MSVTPRYRHIIRNPLSIKTIEPPTLGNPVGYKCINNLHQYTYAHVVLDEQFINLTAFLSYMSLPLVQFTQSSQKESQDRSVVNHSAFTLLTLTSLPEGLHDVSTYPALFARLVERGWSDDDIKKLAGENLLRVMERVEEVTRIR